MIVRPAVLAVVEKPLAKGLPFAEARDVLAGFDHHDARGRLETRELVRHHRGADPGADDADVAFDDSAFLQDDHETPARVAEATRGPLRVNTATRQKTVSATDCT